MNADERFMDLLLERVLGGAEVPRIQVPSTRGSLIQDPVRALAPQRRPSGRSWLWGAAAVVLLGLGLGLLASIPASHVATMPRGVRAPASSTVAEDAGVLRITKGFALVDDGAKPVAFEGGVLTTVEGQVVVVAGDVPTGAALRDMLTWLTGSAGVNADAAALLGRPEHWLSGNASSMALLSGGALLSGSTDVSWAGRTWNRGRADAPLRVALVASRDAVGRLGRLSPAMKVVDVDAGGTFVAALARIATLRHIDLSGCKGVDDDALRPLRRLEGLKRLHLAHTRVTTRGLAWLAGCEQLEHLDLRGLRGITGQGITLLADTHEHRLAHLDLRDGPQVDAEVLAALGRCHALRSVSLTVTTALDADAWQALGRLEHLRSLHLDAPPEAVPGAVLDQLRALLPTCEIRVARTGTER